MNQQIDKLAETGKVGVLFDLDGVLIDSESQYTIFWDSIEKRFPTGIENFALAIKGNTLTRILSLYPDDETRQEIKRLIHEFENTMKYPVFPGVTKFLNELREAGIPTAIVTSSDNVKMDYFFSQHPRFNEYLTAIINGSMVTRSKPDPQGYLMGAEAIGRDIAGCYVFEDSLQGLEAGMRAGATVIGLATTNSRDKLAGRTHMIIDSFEGFDLRQMLSVTKD